MDAIDCEVMRVEGLAYRRIISTTKYGKVFLVEWLKYNQLFSLQKIERSHYEQNAINIIRNLYHFNVIKVYKTYMREKFVYLLMDYCPFDVQRYIEERGVLSESRFVEAAYYMIQSIRSMHSKRICHNSIRPSKFLVDKYGRVQISEFNYAVQYKESEEKEFLHAKSVDVWGLGVTFYYMLTGRLITDLFFDEEKALTKDFSHIIFPSNISNECINLITGCLNNNEKSRVTIDNLLESPIFQSFRSANIAAPKKQSFSANNSMHSIPIIVKPVLTRLISVTN